MDEDEGSYLHTARAYKVRADAHAEQNDYVAASADYWQSFWLLDYLDVDIYKIEVLLDLSKALIVTGEFEEAKPLISQAREIGRTASLIRAQANADLLEARILAKQGEDEQAKKLLTRARAAFAASPDKHLVFQCDFELGKVLQQTDHMLAAVQFESALEQAQINKYELDDHAIYLALAQSYLEVGRADAVVARASTVDIQKLPNPDWVAGASNYHARALVLIGQCEQALEQLAFVLDATNTELDPSHRAYAQETKARALYAMGQAQQALEILNPLLLQFSLEQSQEDCRRIAGLIQDCTLKISQDDASLVGFQSFETSPDDASDAIGDL